MIAEPASPFGVPVLMAPVSVSFASMRLITLGIHDLWQRIIAADPKADYRPLILSYDVHPTAAGPVLIEVNTNAGGILTAIEAARHGNECCAEWERGLLEQRVLALFRRDLLGDDAQSTGVVAIVDDQLASQALLAEMHALAALIRPHTRQVLVVDAAELAYSDRRLWHGDTAIERVYWRSTDFLLTDPTHAPIRRAMQEGTIVIAPTPEAYGAIADKRRLVDWSRQPELSRDETMGVVFRIAETSLLPIPSIPAESTETRLVACFFRSCTNTSVTPFVSKGTRFVAFEWKLTYRPLAEMRHPPE